MSSLDYLDLCRLCLVKDRVSVPIFEGEGDVRQIFLKIAACLPVKVAREDKLPKKICDDCVYKVELLYQFWNTTASAEKQLLQWLGDVSLDDKQGYVTGAHNQSLMKPGQNPVENRLDGSVMQQVNDHPNNMGMGMMDSMGMGMPMMITTSGQQQQSQQQQQMTSVPMDTGGNSVQNVQAVPGPSTQSTHEQIAQQKAINPSSNQDDDEDESEEDDNSDDECDGDDGLPVKEESEEDPNSSRTIEPTTFVNVSLACDEAGPSGLQQQKIGEMPEMVMPTADGDPKSGFIAPDPLGPDFLTVKIMDDFFRIPKSLCYFMVKHPPLDKKSASSQRTKKKSKGDDERRDRVKKRTRSSAVGESEEIPEVKKECISDDVLSADETSRKKNIADNEKSEKIEGLKKSTEVTTDSPIDCSSLVEATLDPPLRKRRRKNSPKRKNVRKKKPSARAEKSKKSMSPSKYSSNDANNEDLDDVSLDQREENTTKRKKLSKARAPVSFVCETCGRSFPRKSALKVHMVNHSTVKSHKCDICEKLFKRKSALTTHMPLHSGTKFSCDECDYTTTSKIAVRYHVRRMHRKDFRYKCDECGKSFMSNSELKDHKTSHLGTKSFICEFCGKGYLQKSSLTAHKRSVHGVVLKVFKKDHECKICNKFFASEYLLQNHVGIHSRKFLCTHCGKEFATNHGLLLHNRMHTGERPFQCRYCSKSFVRSNALAVHKLTHTGERPYVCDLCGKSFTQRTTMMAHRKKHPGSHPPPPPTQLSKLESIVEPNS